MMARPITSVLSLAMLHLHKGDIFYTHFLDRQVFSAAYRYGRKVKTENCILITGKGRKSDLKAQNLVRVTLTNEPVSIETTWFTWSQNKKNSSTVIFKNWKKENWSERQRRMKLLANSVRLVKPTTKSALEAEKALLKMMRDYQRKFTKP